MKVQGSEVVCSALALCQLLCLYLYRHSKGLKHQTFSFLKSYFIRVVKHGGNPVMLLYVYLATSILFKEVITHLEPYFDAAQ